MEAQVPEFTIDRREPADRRRRCGGSGSFDRRTDDRRIAPKSSQLPPARLSVLEITELTADLAHELDPSLQVLGVTGAGDGCSYVEILVGVHRCAAEPCRIVIGVDRGVTAVDLVETVRQGLRDYLDSITSA